MPLQKTKLLYTALLATAFLYACDENTELRSDAGETASIEAPKNKTADQDAYRRQTALQNPDWVAVETLPSQWSGLYEKDCAIGGPEKTSFFTYNSHLQNTQYHFTYIVYPSSLDKEPKAEVHPFTFKVWQNKNWPQHYLLFTADSFTQILIEDGISQGLHQTLDGSPWDSTANYQTRYKTTDAVRWAANLEIQEDYGTRPPCDPKLAIPWGSQIFKTKSGKSILLKDILIDDLAR